ncbi:hypothetical protein C2G38_2215644 [Gigaspora rosea]|uniref:Uncharacterized protein n=1 Tax=Gigaspora rosea TaxID=44941 RepID=A0A397U9K7_9GLOM|nr:hypothetical protein C2G38_2215644 [Gigaspora rosea]
MEYNICSNDNNTNEVIITALEELDNTFFVECLDSESDEDSNFLSDIEPISDINDDNIPLSLLNEFDFIDVPDNYIEDKIYDELKLSGQKFFEKGKYLCCSKHSCFEQIGYEKFLARQAKFESLDKNIKYLHFGYYYNNDISVCCDTYLALTGISYKYLENIKQHLQEHGLEERIHGNTGRAPKNIKRIEVNYDVACDIFKFLKNYSNIHSMPSPGQYFA